MHRPAEPHLETQSATATPSRRGVLLSAAAWTAVIAVARHASVLPAFAGDAGTEGEPFTPDLVQKYAEELSQKEFKRPAIEADEVFNALNAEQYRDIRFRPEQALWQSERLGAEVHLLPRGWIYETPVSIRVVDNGIAKKLTADSRMFAFGPKIEKAAEAAPYAFSGFQLKSPLNRTDLNEDVLVFHGASYFRAVGRGQVYGLSARGLAVNTAQPSGEEFPIFRGFWIEKPRSPGADVVIHGLLDSPSVAGAYRFVVRPGENTECDVQAVLYPRQTLPHVGLAPLTSMFLRGSAHRRVNGDIRPSVHNSEGLAILNGRGERIWRPLSNPRTLQTSAFVDKNPRGFGLMQRDRRFANFEDINARFEDRPSLWVELLGAWGDGFVELIEIPSEEEIHDNIVAYWNPGVPLEPGKPHAFAYRMHWGAGSPNARAPSEVVRTAIAQTRKENVLQFVVDFAGPALADSLESPQADLSASTGTIGQAVVQKHPEIGGVRVAFELDTGGAEMVELRLALKFADHYVSETWLYRWTA